MDTNENMKWQILISYECNTLELAVTRLSWSNEENCMVAKFKHITHTYIHTGHYNLSVRILAHLSILISYNNATCRVLHKKQLEKSIIIKNGVPQELLLLPILDAVIQKSTNHRIGITWELQDRLGTWTVQMMY